MDRIDLRAMGNAASMAAGAPYQMSGFRNRTCATHTMLVANAFNGNAGFAEGVGGSFSGPNFRGIEVVQCSYSGFGVFVFCLASQVIPNDYFTHLMIWPDQNTNQLPFMVLRAADATIQHVTTSSGPSKIWNWNSGVTFPTWGNGWSIRVQLLHSP
jgi:hypothetical protein